MDNLSPEQSNKLLHFQELTGIEDMARCAELLGRYNWDLEVAIQTHLSASEGFESVFNNNQNHVLPRHNTDRIPDVDIFPRDQRSLHSQQLRMMRHEQQNVGLIQSIFQWFTLLLLLPFRFTYYTIVGIFSFICSLFRTDPRTIVTDPLGDVRTFLNNYERQYGFIHPAWAEITYGEALSSARSHIRFLFVYLHADNHAECDQFCRTTLSNPRLVDLINQSMISWSCNVNSPEGFRVSKALRANNHPFVALISLRRNRMTVIARSEGYIEAQELSTRLRRIMDAAEPELIAARADREEREMNQSLRQQQDEDYLSSLRADQEKMRRKREEEEQLRRQEEEKRRAAEEEKQRQQAVELRKEHIRSKMITEPSEDEHDVVRIMVKLPSGIRLERRFRGAESLESLYNFIFVHEAAPDDFQVVTSFPRRVVPCQPTNDNPSPPSFSEFGFSKAEMLLVLDNQA